ncbi:MAG TPA: hypothetical protein VHD95_11360 [Rhizomicrobium sp.]|nr:hypothetical protein [Rhizomicrobium sp.]
MHTQIANHPDWSRRAEEFEQLFGIAVLVGRIALVPPIGLKARDGLGEGQINRAGWEPVVSGAVLCQRFGFPRGAFGRDRLALFVDAVTRIPSAIDHEIEGPLLASLIEIHGHN